MASSWAPPHKQIVLSFPFLNPRHHLIIMEISLLEPPCKGVSMATSRGRTQKRCSTGCSKNSSTSGSTSGEECQPASQNSVALGILYQSSKPPLRNGCWPVPGCEVHAKCGLQDIHQAQSWTPEAGCAHAHCSREAD